MGVGLLWEAVEAEATVGKAALQMMEGKALAVDTALWIMEGIQQSALMEHFPREEARAVKVIFERVRDTC